MCGRFFVGFLTLPVLLLSACGGGSTSGSGSGQEADPVVVDYPIAYIRRPLLREEDSTELLDQDFFEPQLFKPGAELWIKDRASASAEELELGSQLFTDPIDIRSLSASADGRRLVFSLRAPEIEDADEDEQPTWNIWLYDLDTTELVRIIDSEIIAEEGQDIDPAFLPDGRIVFASTRQRRAKAVLLDENKPQYAALAESNNEAAFNLHTMDADGTNLEQITFNQNHDLQPAVLADGRIVFNRVDSASGADVVSLFTVFPDGSDLSRYYGYHSQAMAERDDTLETLPIIYNQPRVMPDGKILAKVITPEFQDSGGDLVLIDGANYAEAYSEPEMAGLLQGQASIITGDIFLDDISLSGRYASAYPLNDGTDRLLVSWSQCRLQEPDSGTIRPCLNEYLEQEGIEEADPLYGLWMYDISDGTQKPLVTGEEGFMFVEAVAMESRPAETYHPEKIAGIDTDADLVEEGFGVLHIRSVYDLDGSNSEDETLSQLRNPLITNPADLPARFLRIYKAVSIPDRDIRNFDRSAFGVANGFMRELLGYTPIQPDGSVKVKIPADVAFGFEILNADGSRISDVHDIWLQLRPGEVRNCTGCHDADSEIPHGRRDIEPSSINAGAPSDAPFSNTEPALVAQMGETMAQAMARIAGTAQLTGDLSYDDLWTDPLVAIKAASFDFLYSDLETQTPISDISCDSNWSSQCRSVIHYPVHIQPLWDLPRAVASGESCASCHSNRDALDQLQVPPGQLELAADPSPSDQDYATSYVELLRNDAEQELLMGALVDRLIEVTDNNGNPVYQTDENGNVLTDINGDPIPETRTINVPRFLSPRGALLSNRFFDVFDPGASHDGFLSPAELKLIREWLDMGAQYYNDPFVAPVN